MIPLGGVERRPLEVLDPGRGRKRRAGQLADRGDEDVELARLAALGLDRPAPALLVEARRGHLGAEPQVRGRRRTPPRGARGSRGSPAAGRSGSTTRGRARTRTSRGGRGRRRRRRGRCSPARRRRPTRRARRRRCRRRPACLSRIAIPMPPNPAPTMPTEGGLPFALLTRRTLPTRSPGSRRTISTCGRASASSRRARGRGRSGASTCRSARPARSSRLQTTAQRLQRGRDPQHFFFVFTSRFTAEKASRPS